MIGGELVDGRWMEDGKEEEEEEGDLYSFDCIRSLLGLVLTTSLMSLTTRPSGHCDCTTGCFFSLNHYQP